jgi:hypothetical protein
VHRSGADDWPVYERQALGMEDEGPRLGSSQTTVEADQLLERAALGARGSSPSIRPSET